MHNVDMVFMDKSDLIQLQAESLCKFLGWRDSKSVHVNLTSEGIRIAKGHRKASIFWYEVNIHVHNLYGFGPHKNGRRQIICGFFVAIVQIGKTYRCGIYSWLAQTIFPQSSSGSNGTVRSVCGHVQ